MIGAATQLGSKFLGLPSQGVGQRSKSHVQPEGPSYRVHTIFDLNQTAPTLIRLGQDQTERDDPRIFVDQRSVIASFKTSAPDVTVDEGGQLGPGILLEQEQEAHPSASYSMVIRPPLTGRPSIKLGENTKKVIGENGVRRFAEFKGYQQGWDYDHGDPLSISSVRILEWFLRQIPEVAVCDPSLFLTHYGNLQLGWEDSRGDSVEIEFFPNKLEYYIEALNEEDSVDLRNIGDFINKVRSIIT